MTHAAAIYQGLTTSEIEEARRALEQSRDGIINATNALSEAQWNYRPASGGWSAAQVVEHVAFVQELIFGLISREPAESSDVPSPDAPTIDEIVKTKFPVRNKKFNGPDLVQPKGAWTPAESLERLSSSTAQFIERLETTPGLRLHRFPSRPLEAFTEGKYELMDGYQWILGAAMHTTRHIDQILEIVG